MFGLGSGSVNPNSFRCIRLHDRRTILDEPFSCGSASLTNTTAPSRERLAHGFGPAFSYWFRQLDLGLLGLDKNRNQIYFTLGTALSVTRIPIGKTGRLWQTVRQTFRRGNGWVKQTRCTQCR